MECFGVQKKKPIPDETIPDETIPDEIIPFIKKWVSIENIICRKGNFDLQDKLGTGTYINNDNFKHV